MTKNTVRAVAVFLLSMILSSCGALGTESGMTSVSGTAAANGTAVADRVWKNAYKSYMDNIYKTSKHKDRLHYFIKNIDQTDAPELFLIDYSADDSDDIMKIYTYRDDGVQEIGRSGLTGTTRLLYSEDPSCPGVFTFEVGGGYEWYGYMTIQDGKFTDMDLWNEDFSGISKILKKDRERIEETSSDKLLISESKTAYKNDQDIEKLKLKSDNVIQESTVHVGSGSAVEWREK